MINPSTGRKYWVQGIVQGVGFRPFVYGLAKKLGLNGWVRNTSSGVDIVVCGMPGSIDEFDQQLRNNFPPLARIDTLTSEPINDCTYDTFTIFSSQPQPGDFMPISADMSICADCMSELFSPEDHRFRYPFINCTNCGPRFTIIRDIPYDRPKTTMNSFPMCPSCAQEYGNPLDRRFHAQPIACPVCGPHVWLEGKDGAMAEKDAAINTARAWLKEGKILAIKGLGGFHLACDAHNDHAVTELRDRKRKSGKPFALMVFNLEIARRYSKINPQEEQLLISRQKPIVLLKRSEIKKLADDVAPLQDSLGFMLPYTPLHLLLLEPEADFPEVLVMTSGNHSEEPIAYDNEEARLRLTPLVDAFLMHNRPIHMRTDDSVTRIIAEKPYPLRRARGYAPDPILIPSTTESILAVGAELKNTFCLTRDRYAFISHHIGDLENYETFQSFEEGIKHFEQLFRITPQTLACDLHPNYLSTRYALTRSVEHNTPLVRIQHHHAHLAACLADNEWVGDEPVIGLSFDGTGFGADGNIWGGEFLLGDYRSYQRLYHIKNVPMPGGDVAIRKTARMALAYLWMYDLAWDTDLLPITFLCADERRTLRSQLENSINAPLTSSMGRLFDAVSALLGIRMEITYEGQAAIELENVIDSSEEGYYPIDLADNTVNMHPLFVSLIQDWRQNTAIPIIASRFHNSIIEATRAICDNIRSQYKVSTIALSGGVWQNRYLLENSIHKLAADGFNVLIHRKVPPNDGCISLGQAVIAAHTDMNEFTR